MNEYRKKIKMRIVIECIVSVVALLLVAFSQTKMHSMKSAGTDVESYLSFQRGLLFAWFIIMVRSLWSYAKALGNEKQLKKQYIKEHDERSVRILTEARSTSYWVTLVGLLTATMVAAFYNYIVFFTLAGVVFCMGTIGLVAKIYYWKKL